MSPPVTSSMNCLQVGQSPLGVAVVILVIRSARSCGRIRPVFEIDHAAWRVEQPRICIPFVGGGRVPAISTRQAFHTAADRSCAGQFGSDPGLSARTAVWRQTLRIRSVAANVSSVRQRCRPTPATFPSQPRSASRGGSGG